mgnify:CR=1 FL=1
MRPSAELRSRPETSGQTRGAGACNPSRHDHRMTARIFMSADLRDRKFPTPGFRHIREQARANDIDRGGWNSYIGHGDRTETETVQL